MLYGLLSLVLHRISWIYLSPDRGSLSDSLDVGEGVLWTAYLASPGRAVVATFTGWSHVVFWDD